MSKSFLMNIKGKGVTEIKSLSDLFNIRESGACVFHFPADSSTLSPPPPPEAIGFMSLAGTSVSGELKVANPSDLGFPGAWRITMSFDFAGKNLAAMVIIGATPTPIGPIWSYHNEGVGLIPEYPGKVPVISPDGTAWEYVQTASTPDPLSIIRRSSDGTAKISTPTDPLDISNKAYVDAQIRDLYELTDLLQMSTSGIVRFHFPLDLVNWIPSIGPDAQDAIVPGSILLGLVNIVSTDAIGIPGFYRTLDIPLGTSSLMGHIYPEAFGIPNGWAYSHGLPDLGDQYTVIGNLTGIDTIPATSLIAFPGNTASMVRRKSDGTTQMADPKTADDVANKRYVDALFTTRKLFTPATTTGGYSQISTSHDGVWDIATIDLPSATSGSAIPVRQNFGHIKVPAAPFDDFSAASKQYVDINGWQAAPPVSATATGTKGAKAYDANYLYICVATNTWRRTPLATW